MATRGKAINVKIATAKVIKALETKLEKIKSDYANQSENDAKYMKAQEKWRKEVAKWAMGEISKAQNIRTNYRSWNKTLNVDFDLTCEENDFPKEPIQEHEQIHRHTYNEMVDEIENAIRILKMTDEEVVSTSTYNAIARYL